MNDLDRLRIEYADRKRRYTNSDIYSHFNQSHLFTLQQRQRKTLKLLRKHGLCSLEGTQILELGCGSGGVLLEYLTYGASPSNLHGTYLLPDRVRIASRQLSHLSLTCADGQSLPYPSKAFDLVLQYTVFTSVLDDSVKSNLARRLYRGKKRS